MAIRSKKLKKSPPLTVDDFLRSVPVANVSMKVEGRADGSALVSIPMRRPGWLVPPLTWILPYSSHRRVELDPVGAGVLQLCDGQRTVEDIIEEFADRHRLSFRESQLPVTQFIRMMLERGLVAAIGTNEDADKP